MPFSPKVLDSCRFLGFMTALSVAYGVAHDLVTAHVAVDYFTVHHPKLVESTSPLVMALLWGFLATFWVGIGAGLVLVGANLLGPWKSLAWPLIRRRCVFLMGGLWAGAMLVLTGVYALASLAPVAKRGPTFEHDRRLIAVALTHGFSYSASALVVLGLGVWIVIRRRKAT